MKFRVVIFSFLFSFACENKEPEEHTSWKKKRYDALNIPVPLTEKKARSYIKMDEDQRKYNIRGCWFAFLKRVKAWLF